MKRTRTIVFMGLFIAINIVLVRLLSFMPIQQVRIDFGFLPLALSSAMFGPIIGGITGVVADITGFTLFAKGNYFPGLTLSAFVTGVIYGLLLFKKPNTLLRISIAAVLNVIIVELAMNTVWLSILYDVEISSMLIPRIIKATVMIPTQIFATYTICKALKIFITREAITNS